MRPSRKSRLVPTFATAFPGTAIAVLATCVLAAPVSAQKQPQAIYPLLSDLLDATSTYGPVMLLGNPTPPAPPANGVCVNTYFYSGGHDVRTPNIATLNTTDFQVDVEFNIAVLPTLFAPVLMAGHSYRWIGIYVQANGTVGLKYNNSNFTWSTTTLTRGKWYIASLKYEAGTVELILDGHLVHTASIGALTTGNNPNFTTNDYSNGTTHNGCIRNLAIWNDTTLGGVASATDYGSLCDQLRMTAKGVPSLGNAGFGLTVSNVKPVSPLVYVVLGQAMVNPGVDLTPFGMAGCYSYTNLDIGPLPPAVAIGGVAFASLPIPNLSTLSGLVLYSQGIGFSTTTSFGLATANGTQLVVGL